MDGASRGNPGPSGIGAVLLPSDGKAERPRQLSKYIGETTNNVAEYLALVYALQEALRGGYTDVTVKTDSELLARQLNGEYRVRNRQLKLFHDLAADVIRGFRVFSIHHIPRTQNALADRLAGQAVSSRSL